MQLVQTALIKPVANANVLGWYDGNDAVQSTSIAISPETDYLVQIRRTSGNNATFDWLLRRLSDGVEQTGQTQAGASDANAGNSYTVSFSTAQSGFMTGRLSHAVLIPDNSVNAAGVVKDWMVQQYTGTQNYEDGEHASFFAELDITSTTK